MAFRFFKKKNDGESDPPVSTEEAESSTGLFKRLTRAVARTRRVFSRTVLGAVGLGRKIDDETLEALEEAMIEADFGVETTDHLMQVIRAGWKSGKIETTDQVTPFIREELKLRLTRRGNELQFADTGTTVILVVGVNGAGKTTSIAKLAWHLEQSGRHVILAAADTYRAAAVEQLTAWSKRIGCEIVTGKDGADPASVVYKAALRALEVNADVLLVDTAGRLHTQKGLMDELAKIGRACSGGGRIDGAPHETILVIDATTGQNAITQTEMFKNAAQVTGLFLAKLDGSAKGGAVLTINEKVEVPVKFVGLGEGYEDMQLFDAEQFVDALFEEDPGDADE